MGRFRFVSWVGLVWLTACGRDEALTSVRGPDAGAAGAEAGVDPCGALDALLAVPGVPERLCALNQPSANQPSGDDAVDQCLLCAAGVTAVQALFPALSCPTQLSDCPLEDATLRDCFEDVGQLMTEALPGCTPDNDTTLDPTSLALRVATSSCGPVIAVCPPLQDLVFGLLGAAL